MSKVNKKEMFSLIVLQDLEEIFTLKGD